jgi:hypothetical protein
VDWAEKKEEERRYFIFWYALDKEDKKRGCRERKIQRGGKECHPSQVRGENKWFRTTATSNTLHPDPRHPLL